jgi:hypothetical protein
VADILKDEVWFDEGELVEILLKECKNESDISRLAVVSKIG